MRISWWKRLEATLDVLVCDARRAFNDPQARPRSRSQRRWAGVALVALCGLPLVALALGFAGVVLVDGRVVAAGVVVGLAWVACFHMAASWPNDQEPPAL